MVEEPVGSAGFWDFVIILYEDGGIWVVCFLALAFMFYRLVWKVWSSAMQRMENEIKRVTAERDFYQSKSFQDLLTSDPTDHTTNNEGEK